MMSSMTYLSYASLKHNVTSQAFDYINTLQYLVKTCYNSKQNHLVYTKELIYYTKKTIKYRRLKQSE